MGAGRWCKEWSGVRLNVGYVAFLCWFHVVREGGWSFQFSSVGVIVRGEGRRERGGEEEEKRRGRGVGPERKRIEKGRRRDRDEE